MWILPTGPFWKPRDASRILSAFKHLRCIAWLASEGGGDTPAIRNHLRAFGQFAGPKTNILVQRTLNHLSSRKTIYSDIAWFDSQQGESFVSFLSRSTAGTDSTLSFILNDELSVENWSKAVTGLEWLWLLGNDKLTAPDTPLDADPVVSAYRITDGETQRCCRPGFRRAENLGGCRWPNHRWRSAGYERTFRPVVSTRSPFESRSLISLNTCEEGRHEVRSGWMKPLTLMIRRTVNVGIALGR